MALTGRGASRRQPTSTKGEIAIFLLVGLGNPGKRYRDTRHNIGFMVLDLLATKLGASVWRDEHHALVSRATDGDQSLVLAKPTTFMNLSGQAVQAVASYYRVPVEQILVVSDDLDLQFGRMRLRSGGSPGGHNGLRSIIASLESAAFLRLRLGIGRPAQGDPLDWVLSPFEADQRQELERVCIEAVEAALIVLHQGILVAMNLYNGRTDGREITARAPGTSVEPVASKGGITHVS